MQNLMSLMKAEENPSTLMCLMLCVSLLIPLAPVEMTSRIKVPKWMHETGQKMGTLELDRLIYVFLFRVVQFVPLKSHSIS